MAVKDLLHVLRTLGCVAVRQRGSHLTVRCGACQTVIPMHRDVAPGTLREIARALTPCLGAGWLEKER